MVAPAFLDPVLVRIEDDGRPNLVFAGVLFGLLTETWDRRGRAESERLEGEGFVQTVDFGEKGVGDGAVGEDEDGARAWWRDRRADEVGAVSVVEYR